MNYKRQKYNKNANIRQLLVLLYIVYYIGLTGLGSLHDTNHNRYIQNNNTKNINLSSISNNNLTKEDSECEMCQWIMISNTSLPQFNSIQFEAQSNRINSPDNSSDIITRYCNHLNSRAPPFLVS
ncbi:MAG: hypothetical protein ABSG15_09500 [FCB group bacterium]|jgi:hypothetical protein